MRNTPNSDKSDRNCKTRSPCAGDAVCRCQPEPEASFQVQLVEGTQAFLRVIGRELSILTIAADGLKTKGKPDPDFR